MKSKKAVEKEFNKKLKEAQAFIEPYVDMVLFLSADEDDSENIDQAVADWAVAACTVKILHPDLEIVDLLPQNLDATMERVNFGNESHQHIASVCPGLESYI